MDRNSNHEKLNGACTTITVGLSKLDKIDCHFCRDRLNILSLLMHIEVNRKNYKLAKLVLFIADLLA